MKNKFIRLSKGYQDDAGVDITVNKKVIFKSHEMTVVDLGIGITPRKNEMVVIAPRSSYAAKGLIICNCPIDPYYTGYIHGVVYNGSNDDVICDEGQAFCQAIIIKIRTIRNVKIKKKGKRGDHSFGSTNE